MTDNTENDDGRNADPFAADVGSRFTSNTRILEIEEELREEGVDIGNPARPLAASDTDVAELREEIAAEAGSDDPDQERIGALNRQLKHLKQYNES